MLLPKLLGLEFIYPGKVRIGHGGEVGSWPIEDKHKINWYKNNDFGSYKSYHILNSYSDFFGGYWHDEDFSFGHYSDFDEKPGKKLWIWGLAEEGMIWEDLLTDTDGQYIEFQAGKLFSQAANSSTKTPYKHKEFAPHDTDIMNEIWFPLKETGGMVAASEFAVLNISVNNDKQHIVLSALQTINDDLKFYKNNELFLTKRIKLKPLELFETTININKNEEIKSYWEKTNLSINQVKKSLLVDRPLLPNQDFNWNSAYGYFTTGLELEKQREYVGAKKAYQKALEKDAGFLPVLNRMAQLHYRQMNYSMAFEFIQKALAIDTYNGETNYLLGLVSLEVGDIATSKNGFSIAMGDTAFRSSAATEIANIFLVEKDWKKAYRYSKKALAYNLYNIDALQINALANRKMGNIEEAKTVLRRIAELDTTNSFRKFEIFKIFNETSDKKLFAEGITNELPHESFLDLAINYYKKGFVEEAIDVLKLAPPNPIVNLWLAYLVPDETDVFLNRALKQSAEFVFPHRIETAKVCQIMLKKNLHWKLRYYLGLMLWDMQKVEKAKEQFLACGNEPDFSAFYLAKAKILDSKEAQLKTIKKAMELEPKNWRGALALAKYYLADNQPTKAKKTIFPFLKSHLEQPAIGLCYALSLSREKHYLETLKFLENYELLPFEGSTVGRDLYNEVCIRAAIKALKNKKYNMAIELANKAKLWPINLGVGRPYDVDERLEDYILYLTYAAKGDEAISKKFATKIMKYKHPGFSEENSKLYLQILVLEQYEKQHKSKNLMTLFSKEYPENNYIKWVIAKQQDSAKAKKIAQDIFNDSGTIMAYDTKFKDKRFKLLLDFVREIE